MMLRRESPRQERRVHCQLRICPQLHRRAGGTRRCCHRIPRHRLPAIHRKLQRDRDSAHCRIAAIYIERQIVDGTFRIPAGECCSRGTSEIREWDECLVRRPARAHRKARAVGSDIGEARPLARSAGIQRNTENGGVLSSQTQRRYAHHPGRSNSPEFRARHRIHIGLLLIRPIDHGIIRVPELSCIKWNWIGRGIAPCDGSSYKRSRNFCVGSASNSHPVSGCRGQRIIAGTRAQDKHVHCSPVTMDPARASVFVLSARSARFALNAAPRDAR